MAAHAAAWSDEAYCKSASRWSGLVEGAEGYGCGFVGVRAPCDREV